MSSFNVPVCLSRFSLVSSFVCPGVDYYHHHLDIAVWNISCMHLLVIEKVDEQILQDLRIPLHQVCERSHS